MREFLDFLWDQAHGWRELRAIKGDAVSQMFFPGDSLDRLERAAIASDFEGWDVYTGVLPRTARAGTAEHVFPTTNVLWADVDAKRWIVHDRKPDDFEMGVAKSAALDRILRFPIPPSCINDSGHGYHAFWKLTERVDFEDAAWAMRGIAKWLDGDAVYDAPRILRVPGTTNWKDPQNPVPVRLLKLDHLKKYSISDFNEITFCLDSFDDTLGVGYRSDIKDRRRQDAPDMLRDLIDSEPPKGSRSETLFHAVAWMKELGYSFDEALTVVLNSPVGAKAQERGERWATQEVSRIWGKAHD